MKNFKLDKFQEEAIGYTRKNHSVIVSAPTGAGKTLIAEDVIEECIKNKKGVIYTAPVKALSNQKFRDFSKKYPKHTGILTGDVCINRNAPILIMTTEIFRNAILVDSGFLKSREWIIFDEIHYLDDPQRGTVWEEAIILLPSHMKMLALSATIPNIDEFVDWLSSVHSFEVKSIVEKTRPVPLHFFFQCNNNFYFNFSQLKKDSDLFAKDNSAVIKSNRLHPLLKYLKENSGYPCVYFSFSRRRCEDLAGEVGSFNLLNKSEQSRITTLFNELIEKFNITDSEHINFLYPLIKNGIAYHHAGLLPTLKEIIERLFTTGLIKLIFTTETFALGINMPAKTVTFDNLVKYYGTHTGYIKTRDFYQMAGRAGRRGSDKEGFVFSKINPNKITIPSLEKIIYGNYEPIHSQLNSCYATILNLYKIMGDKILDIYPNSFHFHQAKNWQKKEVTSLLRRKIALLRELSYIVDKTISRKAELAAKVYSFEIPIGELFAQGFLDNLSEEDLFTTILSLVYEPRKGEHRPKLNKRVRRVKRHLDKFARDINRLERKFRVAPLTKRFYFHLSEAGRAWFGGTDFKNLSKFCSVDEGEIVRYFRMSIQAFREIYSSPIIDAGLKTKIKNCLKRINRDVVDAERQLRQEI
ncbi:MAG: DEAD/DEAH box helicase [Candidatus Omnitrophica bacterium]|nr:DEAD/DEAH box helicase [Candidatus Omnitrophota bacterium]